MKTVNINELIPGMILKDAIFNELNSIELLSSNTILTVRHIDLLKNAGISEVSICTENNQKDNFEEIRKEIEESINVKEVLTNIVNQNMKINILTGEGNKPIDEKHEKVINETKEVFNSLMISDDLDFKSIEKNVKEMLPDMIRNNDVLMRLSQLKRSDDYTFEHSLRVSILAANLAKWLGYNDAQIQEVAEAGLLFDIGKMKLPQYILKKGGKITSEELSILEKHTQLGYNILLKTKGVSSAIKYAALQHHERMDGSGYPLRLKSGQIHEYAKIVMICDIFDAMTSKKPYGKGVSKIEAAEYLNWNTDSSFDTKMVYILIHKISEYMLGKKVILNTGEAGKIVYVDVNYPTKPTLQVGSEIIDLRFEKDIKIIKIIEL
ncbi:HD-GYP domain-containing protein [Clostridiaceae bacterium HSG29]|nr:HD-GYP domain-containing protein [Clostridiaceae bacterium HSG29]